jgi:hypothetical protein
MLLMLGIHNALFSVGLEGSPDLLQQIVADHIGRFTTKLNSLFKKV